MYQRTPNIVLQWALPLIVATVAAIYIVFYYLPNRQEYTELTNHEQQGLQAETMNQVMMTTLASDRNRLQLLIDKLETKKQTRLTEEEAASLPALLHNIGESCGVRIDQLTPSHSFALQSFLQQRYSLRLTGGSLPLIAFVYEIEKQIPGARITQFNTNFSQTSQVNSSQLVLEVFADYSEDSN